MSLNANLNVCRRRVQNVLKDKMKRYLALMGSWFRGKMSKEEFDSEARLLFTDNTVRVHNEFLLAMLNRCQSISTTLGSRDLNSRLPAKLDIKSPPPNSS
ncbi:hypothetical protein EB796_020357 [Bugula neritina]|uniref:Uncharacterized protein n=1 Tax=Bugula neritina TaxID=10212 RepID=A0A7J7J5J3_BUGNE|nr:hypothetical protein EB796_020357 [Bugula neritina]